MKKRNYFRCIVLVLLAFSFIALSFKNLVYSGTAGIPLESNPRGIAINPITDIAVVANERSNSVSIVDLKTQTVISTIPVGSAPKGVAINAALNVALVTNSRDNTLSVIDLTTLKVIRTIPVGKGPEGVAVNSNTNISLVVNSDDNSVAVVNLTSFNVINSIAVGHVPKDVAIDPELSLALVTNKRDSNVSVIDLNTYQVTGVITVGSQPQAIDINPETHLAVVANKVDKSITVIDLLTRQMTSIPVGRHPVDVVVNSLNNSALVLCDKEAILLLINLNSNIVVNNFSVNRAARGVAVNNFSNIAGVVDDSTDSLTLIQLPTVIELPNPVPSITSISPNTVLRGTAATLTIAGSGFVRTSAAFIRISAIDYNLSTAFIDNHYLQAEIPKDLLVSAGTFQIVVTNPPVTGGDGGTSNAVNIQVNNPVPAISSIDPLEVIAGAQSLTLTVYGSGFFNDTTVYINDMARSFTLVSPTKIQIGLTATDLAAGTYIKVKASNPAPGGGTSTPATFTVLNPVPIISSISPASIVVGSSDFTLTLSGNNFVRTSIISFNNQQYLTTYISSTQLKATIPSSSVQTIGDYAVSVNNPAPGGGISNQVIFKVTQTPVVEPLPEGSFGKQYEDLIPSDATKSYDPKRFSVITGFVKDKALNPLSGVRVSIHNHSEYGSVLTDSQGRFSIPVEGGGTITVVYEKSGFITTHRQVYIKWNDIANAETIIMIPEDAASTPLSFDGNPATIITHKSTTITDVYGSRSLTMVFSGDNKAYSKLADGTEVLLSSITTRATEFETPESMPAKLPPNSAYTYCSELTVDGAKNVRFEKPVTVYVDNFLGFRVGEKVPVGYYDRDRAVWVPSDNGVVVRLLDTNGDGIVDALDNVGDGLPHDYNVAGLTDPAKFKPNSTYWRVNISHFTPWDCNWPYGPPSDATPPNPGGEPSLDEQQDKDDCDKTSSYCERRSRIFHEDIPIPGTDITLHYASNRVKGYKSIITIPVSGSTVPSSLKRIIVHMELAGRVFETTLSPLPNQKVEFIWAGLDYLGKQITGSRTANISIGFVYQAVYYSAGGVAQAFAQAGTDVTGIRARQEVTSWKRSTLIVHRGGGIDSIAAGWTLSAHHYLNPSDPNTLYKGDGTTIKNDARIITTVAGNGQRGFSGDGGPATQASLYYPYGVAVDSAGNIYIVDVWNSRIRKVGTNGIITTVAGGGSYSWNLGDGGLATQAILYYPHEAAVDSAGNIYIADTSNNRIRKVDTNGIITTVAGGGSYSWNLGDGGPATQASLYWPYGVAVDSTWNIYIADFYNNRIRKVSYPSAIAGFTVAGDTVFTEENVGYILDSTGHHKSTIDLSTGKTLLTFGYNQDKQLISITDQFGNQTTIQRDGSGIPTAITSPDGIVTSLTIDSSNNLTKATYPDNTSYSFTFTTDGLMTDEYDPKNNHFVHQYDTNGKITNISDPEGGSWNYSRTVDNAGNILSNILTGEGNTTSYNDHTDSTGAYTSTKTDPTGATTTISRSSDGLTETQQLSCGMKLNLTYDLDTEYKFKYTKESTKTSPAGLAQITSFLKTYQDTNADKKPDLITDTISINTKNWTVTNNALTGIITSMSPVGRAITTEYDISNLLTKKLTVSGLSPSNYSYNARGRLTGVSVGSRTTTIAYDPNGNIDYIITPDNKTFDYTFDIMGRLKYEYRPDGTVIAYDYDNNGNMTVLTNPKSIANTFDHTANDQRNLWATPLSGSYLYSYDKERKLKTITFPSNKLITNTYTNALLTSTQTPEGVTTFEYGCSSLLSSATKGTEKISFAYDGTLLKTDSRSGLLNQSVNYSYNNDYRLSSITYAGVSYSLLYDNDGLLTTAGSFTITRNASNGLPISVTDGTLTNTRTFSSYGELDNNAYAIAGLNKYSYSLTRDLAGRITQRIENIGGETITNDYGYDSLGRLIEVKKNNSISESYSYDAEGNRLTDGSRAYTYSDEDNILTAGTDSYQFNLDGFLTSKTTASGITNYNYSSRGELLSVTKPDGTVISYDHDAFRRKIAKVMNGTVVEKYLWKGITRLLAIYDANNNLVMRFNYANGRMPVSMEKSGVKYYLLYDQVGSLRGVADISGNIVKRIDYDSFGNILLDSNPSFNVPFGFAGGLYDRDTGLVRFGYRDYDLFIGRWTAKDPIDFKAGDTNLFRYTQSDPVNWVDPWGLAPGDPYSSQHAAAQAATDDVNPLSIGSNTEHGGMIYQNSAGTYSYTPPNSGGAASVNPGGPTACPEGTIPKAYYHTHGAYDPRYDNENFSPADKNYADHYNIDGYVGTPSGDLKYYNHSTGVDVPIGKTRTK